VRQNRWLSPLMIISMMFHALWVTVALFLFLGGPFESNRPMVWEWAQKIVCPTCLDSYDAINTAAQLGRLDVLSLSLTVLGTVLAFGAFASFFLVRSAAVHAAAEEAAHCVAAKLPELLTPEIVSRAILNDERLKLTLLSALRTVEATENQIPEETANDIAAAFEGEQDGH
jgi:hypothetical protein